MFKFNELNPKMMTDKLVNTMKYGGCSPKQEKNGYIGYCYIFLTGLSAFLIGLKWYITPPDSLSSILPDCIMLFGFLHIFTKYWSLVKNTDTISNMLDSLYTQFWSLDVYNTDDKKHALLRYKIANIIARIYTIIVNIAVGLFCFQARIKREFVMDIWIPYKEYLKNSYYFDILFIFEASLFTTAVNFAVVPLDHLFIYLTCFVGEQFRMIEVTILKIDANKSKSTNNSILRKCVEHINIILQFEKKFESIYSLLFVPSIGTNFIMMTISMYGLVAEEDLNRKLTNIFIYVSLTVQLFAYCWAGQFIQNKGLKVGEAAYECNWYNMGPDEQHIKMGLCMIILQSQRKIEHTVGGLMILSMESFADVMRASFSFFTFIVNVRN